MTDKYQQWIAEWLKYNNPHNKCREAAEEMISIFPELQKVRGWVITPEYGEKYPRQHWWCIDKNNNIIDPTASQWMAILDYKPWDEEKGDITGKCINCGEYVINYRTFCDNGKCQKEFMESLKGDGW